MGAHKCRKLSHTIAAVLVLTTVSIGSVHAQSPSSADVLRQTDEAFREVVAKVESREALLKYARLLVQAHNYEGGIAAMESLLLSPNAPPSIRVELAVLYYRLGSYAISEAYLREALADKRLDDALRRQAETMLVDVVKRNKISVVTASLMAGLRAQSNPAAASSEDRVLSRGVLVPRDDRARPKSDIDALLWGKLDHAYDLNAQNEASVVTSLVGVIDHYSSVDSYSYRAAYGNPYDVATIAGSTGIRFKPAPVGAPGLTLRPHVIFGDTLLNGHQYFSAGGLGFEGSYRVSEHLTWGALYQFRHFSYASRSDITNSTLPSGDEHAARVRGVVEVGPNKVLTGEVGYVDRGARRSDFEYSGPEAKVAYAFTYADPFANTGNSWTTTVAASVLQRRFRGADPDVDPTILRRDTERRFALLNVMQLARDTALHIQLEYVNVPSNLPNYRYSNVAGSAGILWNF